ncbi:thymidylate synthase [Candidatus Micrarchaeota archaeon RBG_16_49_10]|nr:MAG: thymidylate synthase [Candidatus Micrarchaeota archaeon RBG_16_49_10]
MKAYLDIVKKILKEGERKENRTGVDTIAIPGAMFEHDMAKGFPLLTTKKIPFRLISSELEFFIKGITDKKWLQERDNHIWDEWCTPDKVAYGHDEATKKRMLQERDLGPIYGWQWRNFGAKYQAYDKPPQCKGVDQLKNIVEKLKKDPTDRRMIVSAWNPVDFHRMALPPCHYSFQVTVIKDKLNLLWNQRSIDTALGLPFNIASYGLLLHLLAKESNLKEGKLVGFLGDTHIYVNHISGLEEQLKRKPFPLPKVRTEKFSTIFDWEYTDSKVEDYQSHPGIRFEIAV